jgi:hypothetical protein
LENKLRNIEDDVVISDCRFPNEISAIKRAGGIVVRVVRGPEPEWYGHALTVNTGPTSMTWTSSKMALERYNIHASETAWIGTKFDAVLDNNSTMDHLYSQVNDLVQGHLGAKEHQLSESQ